MKIFILILFPLLACASPKILKTESLINNLVEARKIGGAVLLVQKEGEVIYKKAFGSANKNEKMTTDHWFDLASLTKVYATTMGMMLLVDAKKIDLDKSITTYLPEFKSKSKITIRHLLSHSAGFQEWKPLYYHAKNKQEAIQFISQWPLKYSVGKERHYSDLGFMILGAIIERVSGMNLEDFMSEFYSKFGVRTAFGPLREQLIASTSMGNPFEERMIKDDNFGYKCVEKFEDFEGWRKYRLTGEVNDGNSHYVFKGVAGHAGLFSTIDDLHRLSGILLEPNKNFITPETISEFIKTDKYGNGLGWAKSSQVLKFNNQSDAFGHYGFTGTISVLFPRTNSALHFLSNRQFHGMKEKGYFDTRSLTEKLIKHFDLK